MDIKFPARKDWITVDHRRALMDKRSTKDTSEDRGLLSSALAPPALEVESEGLQEATGASGSAGTITSTSWRAPTNNMM